MHKILKGLILFMAASNISFAGDSYYSEISGEFKDVGESRLIGGSTEEEELSGIETGGGMEKFYKSSEKVSKEIVPVEGMPFSRACKIGRASCRERVLTDV